MSRSRKSSGPALNDCSDFLYCERRESSCAAMFEMPTDRGARAGVQRKKHGLKPCIDTSKQSS